MVKVTKKATREKGERARVANSVFSSIPTALREKLPKARVARLMTVGAQGVPHAVPVCFVYDGRFFYSPIDRKPKRLAPRRLERLRNIARKPQVALLIDHYEENWKRLWFILIRGEAKLVPDSSNRERAAAIRALKEKYPQYAAGMLANDAPLIRISPEKASHWSSVRQ